VPVSFPFFSVTVLPSSPACPWVHSPKTAFAALANLHSEERKNKSAGIRAKFGCEKKSEHGPYQAIK
jgi:hypothetical protein